MNILLSKSFRKIFLYTGIIMFIFFKTQPAPANLPKSIFEISVNDIDGKPVLLERYKKNVILIVNTASKCGFTGQYDDLQKLYDKYKDQGLIILGFPSNDFMGQEPGSNTEIAEFCRLTYGVSFPMFEKITVKNGKNQHPLYAYLTTKDTNPGFHGKISWNFNKFLISKDGSVINRFSSKVQPLSPEVIQAVESALR